MTYQVRLRRSAREYLARLDRALQERIVKRLEDLASDPWGPAKPLTGADKGKWSSRVGAYRIVFTIDAAAGLIEVSRIGPRGDVYRRK